MNTIVIGSLNTDLVATGLIHFPKPGEHVYGKELLLGPGGKSRNIADMIGHLTPKNTVAMVGRTTRDPYALWKIPVDALEKTGVNTDYVAYSDYEISKKLPGIAVISVDVHGASHIVAIPGVSDEFSVADVEAASPLFKQVGDNQGVMVITLECPFEAVVKAVELAAQYSIKVLFDPGGITPDVAINDLIKHGIYLIKPNEHEAKMLTGIEITDLESARQAAAKLQEQGITNIFITVGVEGAYLFTKDSQTHVPISKVPETGEKDATGCGDQTMATLCAALQKGTSLEEAVKLAVLAGTLQFHKSGIRPVTKEELGASSEAWHS